MYLFMNYNPLIIQYYCILMYHHLPHLLRFPWETSGRSSSLRRKPWSQSKSSRRSWRCSITKSKPGTSDSRYRTYILIQRMWRTVQLSEICHKLHDFHRIIRDTMLWYFTIYKEMAFVVDCLYQIVLFSYYFHYVQLVDSYSIKCQILGYKR